MSEKKRATVLETSVWLPNALLLGVVVLYLVFSRLGGARVQPLVQSDPKTIARIELLEEQLRRQPAAGEQAVELARLYARAGEVPWSLDALRKAERTKGDAPEWRMALGVAYLELGRNLDGLRVLKKALLGCERRACLPATRAKLKIFTRVAELLVERRINARKDQTAASKVLRDVLKPVRPASAVEEETAQDDGSEKSQAPVVEQARPQ